MGKKERKAAAAAAAAALGQRDRLDAQRALEAIERGFDGVPAPDREHRMLYQAEAWDTYLIVDQRREHRGRWQDLPGSHIRDCPDALPHLDEQGIQYYLPALMAHFIRNPKDRKLWSYARLSSTLRPSTGELKAYQRSQFILLTRLQREAIVAYLEHIEAPEEDLLPWRRVLEAGDDPKWFRKFY